MTASERSEGKRYADAVNWVVPGEMPAFVRDMILLPTDTGASLGDKARLVFSALPTEVAKEVEPQLAANGYLVCSNASAHRMDPDVALLILNAPHVNLVGPVNQVDRGRGEKRHPVAAATDDPRSDRRGACAEKVAGRAPEKILVPDAED